MCKKVLFGYLFFCCLGISNIYAINAEEQITVEKNEDYLEDTTIDNIYYEEQPDLSLILAPKFGFNFMTGEKSEFKYNNFKSWNYGVDVGICLPIKMSNFFYGVELDLNHRSLVWDNRRDLLKNNFFHKDIDKSLTKELYENMINNSLSFLDLKLLFAIGYKDSIINYKKSFYFRLLGGVGTTFLNKISLKTKNKDNQEVCLCSIINEGSPLNRVNFAFGFDIGYWRVGLKLLYDFALFAENKDNKIDSSMRPINCNIYFDFL